MAIGDRGGEWNRPPAAAGGRDGAGWRPGGSRMGHHGVSCRGAHGSADPHSRPRNSFRGCSWPAKRGIYSARPQAEPVSCTSERYWTPTRRPLYPSARYQALLRNQIAAVEAEGRHGRPCRGPAQRVCGTHARRPRRLFPALPRRVERPRTPASPATGRRPGAPRLPVGPRGGCRCQPPGLPYRARPRARAVQPGADPGRGRGNQATQGRQRPAPPPAVPELVASEQDSLWSTGYFVRSLGDINVAQAKAYLDRQRAHHALEGRGPAD